MTDAGEPNANISKVIAICRLIRLPNLFTAPGNVLLGYWVTQSPARFDVKMTALVASSCCLYAAGMVWNDVFDVAVDRRERPERPLPANAVLLDSAIWLGVALIVGGLALAAAAGAGSFFVAVLLATMILVYNGLVKATVFGPPAMGICRMLNVGLGMSPAVADHGQLIAGVERLLDLGIVALLPAAHGVYVTGVTWFSRQEAARSQFVLLAPAGIVMAAGFALDALVLARIDSINPLAWIGLASAFAVVARAVLLAVREPESRNVQRAVKTGVFALIAIDAVLLFGLVGPLEGSIVLVLLAPALLVGRWVYST
jgi:4-hydroxybenzoate polyprenyltransferase